MTNKQLIEKLKEDMEMRGFSHHTKDSYLRKAKEVVEYFKKPMMQVTTKDINDKIRMYKKWKIKMYKIVQNYFQKNVHFYIDINKGIERISWNIIVKLKVTIY